MNYLPVYVDVCDHTIVVAGGGEPALAKLRTLVRTSARIRVIDPEISAGVTALAAQHGFSYAARALTAADLAGVRLLYIATDNVQERRRLRRLALDAGVLFNAVDDAGASQFISPAIVDRAPVTIAIGSEGTAPVLVRQIKARIEALLDHSVGPLARLAGSLRPLVRGRLGTAAQRAFWQRFFGGRGARLLQQHGADAARRVLHREAMQEQDAELEQVPGRVSLVGAGPGDPELLTHKARSALDQADVVLTDRLVDSRIIDLARREAQIIEVGKTPHGKSWKQDDINSALIRHARDGHHVVRLKSGDPMVFGRADEEIEALAAAGIACDVVPGVTSAAAAAASIGVSLTRRGRNQSVSFITAQDAYGYAEHDWRALAAPGSVSAIYMGVRAARFVQGRMLLHGADAALPVTVIENASRPNERVLSTTLEQLPQAMRAHDIAGPAIIFLGLAARPAMVAAGRHLVGAASASDKQEVRHVSL